MRKYWLVILIFGLGFFLRAYAIGRYPLRFDQVQILENVDKIRSGNLTLIGPRTGPAEMFTGPLVYYVAAIVSFVTPYPYAAVGMALLFYALTFFILAWVVRRYLGRQFALVYLSLFALSTLIAVLDRTPWNPNLSFLSGALAFFPLIKLFSEKKTEVIDEILLALGVFLGYQAHFSGLLLPGIALLGWFLWSRRVRCLGFILAGTATTLLPTLVFDYKYQWLNLKGLQHLLQGSGQTSSLPSFLDRLTHDFLTVLFNQGRIFIFGIPLLQQALLGLILISAYLMLVRRHTTSVFPLIWIAMFLIPYMIYSGNKPEYYFLMVFPALVFMGAKVMEMIFFPGSFRRIWLSAFFVFSLGGLVPEVMTFSGLTIGDEIGASQFVRKAIKEDPNQTLVYDISTADQVGMKYLLHDLSLPENSPKKIHLIFPGTDQVPATARFGTMAVWIDPRTESNLNYVQIQRLTLISPRDTELLLSLYPRKVFVAAHDALEIYNKMGYWGTLYIFDDQIEKDFTLKTFVNSIAVLWDEEKSGWQEITAEGRQVWIQKVPHKFIIVDLTASGRNTVQQQQLLMSFSVISPL